jgi:hypothetical protein
MGRIGAWTLAAVVAACGGTDGGNGGDAADGATAGADASPAATIDDLVTACVVLGSCEGQGPVECMDDYLPRLRESEIHCLAAAAGDCTAAFACIGLETIDGGCTPGCDGDRAVSCGAVGFATHCPSALFSTGPTCTDAAGSPACGGTAACEGTEAACEGTFLLECQGGVLRGGDCARYGLTCVAAGGFARCTDGTTTPCDGQNYPRCDGDVVVRCESNLEVRHRCAHDVVGCHVLADDPDGYCGLGSDCDPLVDDGSCDGDALTFCAAGIRRTVDCAALGFAGCQPADGLGASRCTP